ncbi:MAG TPA: hypothetical protein VE172_12935 [Stackebrandtia sp.]|uniref:hypothetical protein n=1 Tax=Stackebrandtia sp. TaxID=2023065 RepID=UPI002D54F068|nr:hypothetical protein [Stackebrandtia sp.]HZE39706.1 hypothetical protein [Stackebrandtia sp.]
MYNYWANAAKTDTVRLTMSAAGHPDQSISSTGFGEGTSGSTVHSARMKVHAGEKIKFAETFGANTGTYTTDLKCTGDQGALDYQDGELTGTYTVPHDWTGGQCSFKNTRTMPTVTLQKTWVNGVKGDTANLGVYSNEGRVFGGTSTASGASGSQTDTVTSWKLYSGNEYRLAEILKGDSVDRYDTQLACGGKTIASGRGGMVKVPASGVTCTFTNTFPAKHRVVLTKKWQHAFPGDAVDLEISHGNRRADGSSTAGGDNHDASMDVLAGDTVEMRERFDTSGRANFYTPSLTCNYGIHPDAHGAFTVPKSLASGVPITCAFTNTAKPTTLTLQKKWVDGAKGDAAHLSINGAKGGAGVATSTASGVSGSHTDTQHQATATVYPGDKVRLAETFGTKTGGYTAQLACGGKTIGSGPSGVFEVPADPKDMTCEFTNTRASAKITVVKEWNRAAAGDTAKLEIEGPAADSQASAIATAPQGGTGKSDDTATATIFAGDTVTLAEALPGAGPANTGSYASTLSCDQAGLDVGDGEQGGTFTVPNKPVDVVCTFTNTRTSAMLTVRKSWVHGATGDTADLSAKGSAGDDAGTAGVPASGTGDSADVVEVPVRSGEVIDLAEELGADNTGTYTTALACTAPGLAYQAGARSGTYTVPTDPVAVTCEFTNTRTKASLTLHKTWVDGAKGDTAGLSIDGAEDGGGSATSTATGASGSVADTGHQATATVYSGQKVDLDEVWGAGHVGTYRTRLDCGGKTIASGTSGVFGVPADPKDVTCEFTNTRTKAILTLQKKWVNGAVGDTAELSIDKASSGAGSVAARVPAGGDGVSVDKATAPIHSGDTVDLVEALGSHNRGSYTSAIACDRPGLTATRDGRGGSFHVSASPDAVTCTVTNTGKATGAPAVAKRVESVSAGARPGDWTVTYTVTVTNRDATAVSYSLADRLGFPKGVHVTSKSARWARSAADGSGSGTSKPTANLRQVTGRELPADTMDTYTIVIDATVPAGLSADRARCGGGPGHGWSNTASVTSGSRTVKAHACAAITTRGDTAALDGDPLPITGTPIAKILNAAAVFLGAGMLLILTARKRRRQN